MLNTGYRPATHDSEVRVVTSKAPRRALIMALFSKPTARMLAIIDFLMANPQQSYELTDLTRRLTLNKATCHAILTTMRGAGFLNQDPKTKTYSLGPSMAVVGHAAISQFPSLRCARTELETLVHNLKFD